MALNYVFIAFFLLSFAVALVKLLFFQDYEIFQRIVTGTFDSAKTGAEISLGLIGLMAFWLGIMKVGEKGGMINVFAKAVGPFFNKLFPEIRKTLQRHQFLPQYNPSFPMHAVRLQQLIFQLNKG